jgi:hypothetical protein
VFLSSTSGGAIGLIRALLLVLLSCLMNETLCCATFRCCDVGADHRKVLLVSNFLQRQTSLRLAQDVDVDCLEHTFDD